MTKISAAKHEGPQTEKLPVSGPVLVLLLVSRDTMVEVEMDDFFLSPTITNHFVGGGPGNAAPKKMGFSP